ncbi:MAG: hypothetical protein OEV66_10770, partial [Spirochaetia bacterium]|nr:hypothetical protein [Spirochaetia bacterium]
RYILFLLVSEKKTEEALKFVIRFFSALNRYSSVIPHAHVGYYHILEALELALNENLISKKESDKIWNGSLSKLKKLGKKFPFINGYAIRGEAKTLKMNGDINAAQRKISDAVLWYEQAKNEWERALTYYDAAVLIPEKRDEYIQKGIALCQENGYARDLIRFQLLPDSV